MAVFPSMKATDVLSVILGKPLGYELHSQKGSHRKLRAPGRPPLSFSYHDGATVPPGVVRKLLTAAGLTEAEALSLLGRK